MRYELIEILYGLCIDKSVSLTEIEKEIKNHSMTSLEITYIANKLADKYCFEIEDYRLKNNRAPLADELVASRFPELFEIFINNGLDPNALFKNDDLVTDNIMEALFWFDNASVPLPIMKRLLEMGGDPNLQIDEETLFEKVDFDVVYGAIEQENREKYAMWVKFWLLLIGYGGKLSNGKMTLKMQNGYKSDVFKDYEKFSYRIEFGKNDWVMHIFLADSGEEVAIF